MSYFPNETPQTAAFGEQEVVASAPEVQVMFQYGVDTGATIHDLVGSGTVTGANSMAVIGSGAAASSSARMSTDGILVYRPGQGCKVMFTGVFTTGVVGNTQEVGYGDTNDCLSFGYNGTVFGVFHASFGTPTHIPQTSWNVDKGDGTGTLPVMDWTKGNVFKIQFQFLGFGAIEFYVEHPVSGKFELVHRIQYANANTVPSMQNPSLPLFVSSANTTNTTNVVVQTASMAGFIQGVDNDLAYGYEFDHQASISAERNLFTIRGKATFGGIVNRVKTEIHMISLASEASNKIATFRLYKNATFSGALTYVDVDAAGSSIESSVSNVTVTGGSSVFAIKMGAGGSDVFDLSPIEIDLTSGDTLTITGACQTNSVLGAALSWHEER